MSETYWQPCRSVLFMSNYKWYLYWHSCVLFFQKSQHPLAPMPRNITYLKLPKQETWKQSRSVLCLLYPSMPCLSVLIIRWRVSFVEALLINTEVSSVFFRSSAILTLWIVGILTVGIARLSILLPVTIEWTLWRFSFSVVLMSMLRTKGMLLFVYFVVYCTFISLPSDSTCINHIAYSQGSQTHVE